MIGHPRVSVVIPTCQGGARIADALARLNRQTFTDFEVIVVNDGSTDGTSAVVDQLSRADSRIRLIEQDNQGIAAARNTGIAAARGDFVAFLDDDDLWNPRKLELQLARFDATPDVSVITCYSALVDSSGRLLGWRWGGIDEGDLYRTMLEWDVVSGGSVALVTRSALEESGGFDASIPHRADWDLWIRLSRSHRFASVPRMLVGYTRREGSASRNYERMIADGTRVLRKARMEDIDISDADFEAYLARDLFAIACLGLVDDQPSAAWRYLLRAMQAAPVMILARPRRWGVVMMLALATALPRKLYRDTAVPAMSRAAFGLRAGAAFESLA